MKSRNIGTAVVRTSLACRENVNGGGWISGRMIIAGRGVELPCAAYPAFINGVDKGDKSPGPVPFPVRHGRDVGDDECLVTSDQLQEIRSPRRPTDELVKRKHGRFAACPRHFDGSPPHAVGRSMWRVVFHITQEPKPLLGMTCRGDVQRMMKDPGRWSWNLAVIGRRVEVEDA